MDRGALGRSVLSGLVAAVPIAVVMGLIKDSFWEGVVAGVLYGPVLALMTRMFDTPKAMEKLNLRQRRTVRRKLREGEGTDDPELAPALIEHGSEILSTPFTPKVAAIAAGVMFAFGVTASVLAIARMGGPGLAVGLPLVVLALMVAGLIVGQSEQRRALAAQSVRTTEELVHKG